MRASPFFRNNGLSLSFGGLTLLAVGGHLWTGLFAENQQRLLHHGTPLDLSSYLRSGAFLSSLFENWESEFLQMALFVVLTVGLRQRGSSESKPIEDEPSAQRPISDAPWAAQRGGWVKKIYAHSLSLGLFGLFLISFLGHWYGSYRHAVSEHLAHGRVLGHGLWGHLLDSQFWFESFQNWQSEFFSIAVLVLLTIFLREKGSAQSKDVDAPHFETGGDAAPTEHE